MKVAGIAHNRQATPQHATPMQQRITAPELRQLLNYDRESGVFTWRVPRSRGFKPGDQAGHLHSDGYVYIGVCRKIYKAHRLAWLHVTGEWPAGEIDHRNGQRADNRFDNLRDVVHATNLQNLRGPRSDGQSGFLGVSVHRKSGRWRAQIQVGGKSKSLGLHDTPEAAHAAYIDAKRQHHAGCTL